MKVYKGTDKDMKCRGMQYELGREHEAEHAEICEAGLHSCRAPMDVLRYYGLKDGNRYFEAEADGQIAEQKGGDSKIASTKLTLEAEIGLPGLIKAQMEYVREKAEKGQKAGSGSNLAGGDWSNLAGGDWSNLAGGDWSNLAGGNGSNLAGGNCSNLAGGDGSNLAGGNRSNLAGGNRSNLAGGDWSNLAGGDWSLIVGRNGCKAKGGMNSVIVLTNWEWVGDEYKPTAVRTVVVDGEVYKPDTWYKLKDGAIVEVQNDDAT